MTCKNRIIKWYSRSLVLVAAIFINTAALNAQIQPENPKKNTLVNEAGNNGEMPISSEMIWLVIAGAGYGIKEVAGIKKKADISAPADEMNIVQ